MVLDSHVEKLFESPNLQARNPRAPELRKAVGKSDLFEGHMWTEYKETSAPVDLLSLKTTPQAHLKNLMLKKADKVTGKKEESKGGVKDDSEVVHILKLFNSWHNYQLKNAHLAKASEYVWRIEETKRRLPNLDRTDQLVTIDTVPYEDIKAYVPEPGDLTLEAWLAQCEAAIKEKDKAANTAANEDKQIGGSQGDK